MCKPMENNSSFAEYVKNWKIISILIILLIDKFEAKIDFQHKLCADINCNAPIGFGKTTETYSKSEDHLISFSSNANVTIFGKSEDEELLYIEISGKRGFAPKHLILEEEVIIKNPNVLVKININEETLSNNSEINLNNNVQNNSDLNTHDISDNKSSINQTVNNESIKHEEKLQSSHSESKSETMNVVTDGFTMIDGTLLPKQEYISTVFPTIMTETSSQRNANDLPLNIQNEKILENPVIDKHISLNVKNKNDGYVSKELNQESISDAKSSVDNSNVNDLPSNIQTEIPDNNESVANKLNENKSSDNRDKESIPEIANSDASTLDNKYDVNFGDIDSNLNNLDKDDLNIFHDKTIEDNIQLPNDSNLESVLRNISLDNITSTNVMPVNIQNTENLDNIAVKMNIFERQTSDNDTLNSFSIMFFLQQYINIIKIYTDVISDILPDDIKIILKQLNISSHLVVFTSIIAFNWCLLKFIIAIRFSIKKETDLREIGCKAQRQAYYFEAEKDKLHAEVDKEREKAQLSEDSLQKLEHKVFPMETEIKKLKAERDQLHQRVLTLESELESATEAGFELNKLLSDFLTSQKENVNLNSSVDALQQQITKQSEIVALYENTAKQKERENYELKEKCEKLSVEMDRLKNILKDTENNFEIIQLNNEDLKASKSELLVKFNELQENYSNISHQLTEYTGKHALLLVEIEQFNDKVNCLTNEIGNRDKEIDLLKEIVDKFYCNGNGEPNFTENGIIDSLNELYNAVKIQSQLKNAELERNDLSVKYNDLKLEYQQLNDKILELDVYNKKLKDDKENAMQEKIKAQMELEVLSKYYKEKELEFGKEIGVQHIQRMQKEDDASSLAAQLAALEEENISYKTQFLSMKKEVAETDRRCKIQISQLEKQAHENWIQARNAERKLEEANAEATALRQTLTLNVKSPVDGYVGDISYLDDSASSVSSFHEHFMGAIPPPPPPPPPPPMSLYSSYNGYLPSMHMPFDENDASYGAWNSSMSSQTQMQTNFMPIQNEMLTSNNVRTYSSNQLPLSYVGSVQQQWDASSNRDTYSPASHRSNDQNSRVNSPQLSFNSYPQSMSINPTQYQNSTMNYTNPYSNSVNASDYSFSGYNSISSAVSDSVSHTTSVLSNPIPSHWTKPNGNIPNNVNSREYNETDSRPTSRISDNHTDPHTSIV